VPPRILGQFHHIGQHIAAWLGTWAHAGQAIARPQKLWHEILFLYCYSLTALVSETIPNRCPKIETKVRYICLATGKQKQSFHLLPQDTVLLLRPKVVAKGIFHVDKPAVPALGHRIHRVIVLIAQFELLEVALNPARGCTLGEHGVPTPDPPRDQHLGKGMPGLLGDLVQSRVLVDLLSGCGNLVLGTEGRVRHKKVALRLCVVQEFLLGQEGMDLNLVHRRGHSGVGVELFELGDGEVADTDGTGLTAAVEVLHGAPCRFMVLGEVLFDHILWST
jgi:hypothetical protein